MQINVDSLGTIVSDVLDDVLNASNGYKESISTGIFKMDHMLGRFRNGNLYIVGARPGIGKSSLAMQMAFYAAVNNHKALFVSLEMTSSQIVTRLFSSQTGIKHSILRDGKYNENEINKIVAMADEVKNFPLYIADQTGMTVKDIASTIEQIEPDILFVDYMGLIQPIKPEDRRIEVDKIAYGLKGMAKHFNIPVVCLSQLRRGAIGSDDRKPPVLSDLRDSGAIEQAADVVILLHRVGMESTKIEIHIAKNRHGETGMISGEWIGDTLTFNFDNNTEKAKEKQKND